MAGHVIVVALVFLYLTNKCSIIYVVFNDKVCLIIKVLCNKGFIIIM